MFGDIERVIEENITLKKQLQMLRNSYETLQKQNKELSTLSEEVQTKNSSLHHELCNLQKKYQNSFAQNTKDINTLSAQIEELKDLVEEKQRQLENFQIKMIPNLDQDMIRVKLITEMEGPYQETVEKKDQELFKLKQRVSVFSRKNQLLEFSLETRAKQFKRQLEECKNYYQTENERLMKQIGNLVARRQIKSIDKQMVKTQRKELEELRAHLEYKAQNQEELHRQMQDLKIQKERLLQQISSLNQKNALEMHYAENSSQIKKARFQIEKLEDEVRKRQDENEKMNHKIKQMEKENKKIEEQLRQANYNLKHHLESEKDGLKEQLKEEKDEIRRLRQIKDRQENQIISISSRLKSIEKELEDRKRECQRLREIIHSNQINIKQLEFNKKQKITLSKDFIDQENKPRQRFQSAKKQTYEKNTVIINKKYDNEYVLSLEKKNEKLTQKLEYANKKIVELIQEKAKRGGKKDLTRERAHSQAQMDSHKVCHNNKGLLLEYRDASFIPLVEPTIYLYP